MTARRTLAVVLGAWLLMLFAMFVLLSAQQQEPKSRHDKWGKDDPEAYCLAGKPLPSDTHGHECHCKAPPCLEDGTRDPNAEEDRTCETWCESSPWCLCHVDAGCDMKGM